jgi:hypothetical protein
MKDLKEGWNCKPESATHTHHRGTSVINNSAMSKERCSPRFFFVQEKMLSGEAKALTPDMTGHGISVWHNKNIGGLSMTNVQAAAK